MLQLERRNSQAAIIDLLPFSGRSEAACRWQDLEHCIGNTGLTNSWLWIKTWLNHYADRVQPIFAFARLGNRPVGAALITKATYSLRGIPISSVHLGTAGEPEKETSSIEHNRLLVSPEHLEAFATGLVHTLLQRLHWSELWLDGFVPEHAEALMRAGINAGLQFKVDKRKSPTFDFHKAIDEGHADVLSALGNNTRYSVRRSLRLFDQQLGPRRIEWAEMQEQARDILRELIDLHQKRWLAVGKPGAFRCERVIRYHESLIDAFGLWPQGSLIVFRIKQGETTIGCLFHLVDEGGHVQFYKIGLPLFEDNKLKPGLVTHALCMEECQRRSLLLDEACRNRRLLQYDFLAGDVLYKEQLSNTEGNLIWATAQRGPQMWFIEKARPSFQFAKRLISNAFTGSVLGA